MSTLYEIIELADGEVVLQRLDGDDDPLLRIRFSDQARAYMDGAGIDVAKAMVEAGIRALGSISEARAADQEGERALSPDDDGLELDDTVQTHLIH